MPNTYKMLDLSTAHLPEELAQDLGDVDGVTADELANGWLLYVPRDIDDHVSHYGMKVDDVADLDDAIPEAVIAIWRYAHKHGCRYALLDRDAYECPELPSYDW